MNPALIVFVVAFVADEKHRDAQQAAVCLQDAEDLEYMTELPDVL